MAEPETNDESLADALLDDEATPSAPGGGLIWPISAAIIVIAAAAGGYLAARLATSAPSSAGAAMVEEFDDAAPVGPDEQYVYYDMEPITVNLNEPRLARHVRAEFTFAYLHRDRTVLEEVFKERAPELKNWLILYLSDCSLEDVRGKRNLSRILREVQDTFNERLWPDGRPLIVKVDLKQWTVQ